MIETTQTGSEPIRDRVPRSTQRRTTLITFLALLLVILIFSLRMVQPYLLAVWMGGILALLCMRPYQKLRAWGMPPKLASLMITLGVTFLVIGPMVIFASLVVQQGITVGQEITTNENFSVASILDRIRQWKLFSSVFGDMGTLQRQTRSWIQTAGKGLTGVILGIMSNLPQLLLQLALTAISCFFLILDGKRLIAWTADKIPLDYDVRESLIYSFQNTAVSVIWATLAAALAQASVMFFSYLILDVPAAFLAAGATFIFAWIPMVGSVPVWVIGAIYLWTQGATLKVLLMIGLGFLTGIIDNFVRPFVLKGRGEMHPLVSLVAIFGGIEMFGIIGVFIGPILVAVALSLLQVWPKVGIRFGLIPRDRHLI
jgi:predicted PurR-regulated permease PerM